MLNLKKFFKKEVKKEVKAPEYKACFYRLSEQSGKHSYDYHKELDHYLDRFRERNNRAATLYIAPQGKGYDLLEPGLTVGEALDKGILSQKKVLDKAIYGSNLSISLEQMFDTGGSSYVGTSAIQQTLAQSMSSMSTQDALVRYLPSKAKGNEDTIYLMSSQNSICAEDMHRRANSL
ncbi:hypothetical protein ACRRVB_01795 [Candidatus Cardinium hertigii]|uniref:hypothetical protein n=1 Tax=Candidatus Cardinium hertigii TaxID=247481 RepID=UPI003D7D243B